MHELHRFFYPGKVAVIGVSQRRENLARNIISNMLKHEYTGEIYPVGPRGGAIYGLKIYKEIEELPDGVELAVILTPAPTVPEIVERCGKKGIKHIIIESGGFDEFGGQGQVLAARIKRLLAQYQMRLIGPNGIGVINTENGLCVPFPSMERISPGFVSIVSQSGGVGISFIREFNTENIGINKFISLGNKLDVDESDALDYLATDEGTKVICLYLEGIKRGRTFFETLKKVNKPLIIFKSNTGNLSAKIAQSHTSALVSDDRVVDTAIRQGGGIRVAEVREMVNLAKIFKMPLLAGRRLAIVSRSGGHAVIAADYCQKYGFELPELPKDILERAESRLRAKVIKLSNPMDLGDLYDVEAYKMITSDIIKLPNIDGIVFLFTYFSLYDPSIPEDMISHIISLVEQYKKPIGFCLLSWFEEERRFKKKFTFPIFTTTEEVISALNKSLEFYLRAGHKNEKIPEIKVDKFKVKKMVEGETLDEAKEPVLLGQKALDVIKMYGIKTAESKEVETPEEAGVAAEKLGFPVVLKATSSKLVHKTEFGAVILNLDSKEKVVEAAKNLIERLSKKIPEALDDLRFFVQKQIEGYELIVGSKRDEQFGATILLGWGGILVELLRESVLRLAPVSFDEAARMIQELKGHEILSGFRGRPAADIESLKDAIVRLSILVHQVDEIAELDINPLIVAQDGAYAVDCRIVKSTVELEES